MSPYEDRRRKFIDNLKLHGKFDDFKTKRAKREKERRLRLKEALTKMPVAKRNQLIEENRVKNRKDVQQFRMRQKELKSSNNTELKVSVSDEISENQLPKQSISEDHRKETLKLPKQNCENKVPFTENCQPPPSNNDQLMPTSKSEKQMFQSSNISHGIEVTNAESNEKDSLSQPTNKDQNQKLSTKKCQNKQSSTASTEDRQAQSSAAPCPKDSNSQPATSKEIGKHNELVVTKSIDFEHSYKTQSALSKAVAKTKKSLPSSPSKRKAVVARLLRTFNEDDQRDIIGNTRSKENKTNRGLSSELIEEVRLFYERDSISRISPKIRHLNYKLSEVYDMFMDDCKDENGEDNRPPIKLSKFCALRPLHVFLMSETPQNACFCLYHSNFIQCAESLHKNNPEIPDYRNYELTDFLVCDVPTRDCYFKTCKKCSRTKIDKKIEDIVKRSPNNNKMVKWMAWTKDETANRFQNVAKEGTQHQLMEYFLSIYPKFLLHFYIKKEQEKTFTAHRKRVNSDQYLTEAVLQIDFAENFKCECQDEVHQAHYNQKQISLFTTALHHAKVTHSKVIASDNTHHGKETLVAYLYTKDFPQQ